MPSSTVAICARARSPSLSAFAIAFSLPAFDEMSMGSAKCERSCLESSSQSRGRQRSLPHTNDRSKNGIAPTNAPLSSQEMPCLEPGGDKRNSRTIIRPHLCRENRAIRTYQEQKFECDKGGSAQIFGNERGKSHRQIIAGRRRRFDPVSIPAVCFTEPEVVSAGLSLIEARSQDKDAIVAQFPFSGIGRALSMDAS